MGESGVIIVGAVLKGLSWKAWILALVAAVLSVYSLAVLYEGFLAERYASVFTYPFIDKPAAERAYAALPAGAPAPARREAAWRLAQADPANAESWTAVAFADWTAHGRLTTEGVLALDHSYAVSFFDTGAAVWRVSFALENWAALTPQIRQDALIEAKTALKDPLLGPAMKARLRTIKSPDGRLTALLLLSDAR
jgi:hypothetical protein